jgi:streptogramin lyase
VAITSDDKIWYVDYAAGYLGRYDPARTRSIWFGTDANTIGRALVP